MSAPAPTWVEDLAHRQTAALRDRDDQQATTIDDTQRLNAAIDTGAEAFFEAAAAATIAAARAYNAARGAERLRWAVAHEGGVVAVHAQRVSGTCSLTLSGVLDPAVRARDAGLPGIVVVRRAGGRGETFALAFALAGAELRVTDGAGADLDPEGLARLTIEPWLQMLHAIERS